MTLATTNHTRLVSRFTACLAGTLLFGAAWSAAAQAPSPRAAAAAPRPDRQPPPAEAGESRLRALVVPGGLTAEEVAGLALASSPELEGRRAGTDAARARGTASVADFTPRVGLSARYDRLSSIVPPVFPGGLTLPIYLNNYALSANLTLPVSDYLLRLSRTVGVAKHSIAAAKLDTEASRRKVAADARLTYYDWIRAQAQLLVVQQRAETAQAQVADAGRLFEAGATSKADVLTARAQAKSIDLALVRARQLVDLATTRLRVVTHESHATYQVGEDILAALPPIAGVDNLDRLFEEARAARPEVASLRETEAATVDLAKLNRSGWWPRLDLVGSVVDGNPNARIFPNRQKWDLTWDVGAVLTYSPSDLFGVSGRVREQQANARQVASQRAALIDGLRTEVEEAANAVNAANVSVETAGQALLAADEGYRVRRELYLAGRATQLEVTSAETDLLTARLQVIDANVEARQARVRLARAVGRDVLR